MSSYLFFEPTARPLTNAGATMPGATLTFFLTLTTTPANVYSDSALTTSLGNVITADADGRFVPLYLDGLLTYRVQLMDSDAVLIYDIDPLAPPRDYPPGSVQWHYGTVGQRDAAFPPALWTVLDGTNGSPNFLERFPRIAGGGTVIGSTGGASTDTATTTDESAHTHPGDTTAGHAVTTAEMPVHHHRFLIRVGNYGASGSPTFRTHELTNAQGYVDDNPIVGGQMIEDTGGGDPHTHAGGTTGAGSAHSHAVTVDTLPPWGALWCVMRKY